MSYERLIGEHDAIDRAAHRLAAVAAAPSPDTAAAIGLLSELACIVDQHLRYEDRTIYSRLIAERDAAPAADTPDFEALFQDLSCDWRAYLADWDADCIAADWAGFQAETAAMMARLRERVRLETELVYPLALKQGLVPLREPR